MSASRSAVRHAAAIVAYLVVGALLTFPLVRDFRVRFPSGPADQDVFLFLWNNWWFQHAVVALHSKPYLTDFIYAPFVTDLRLTSSGLLYGLLSMELAVVSVCAVATAAGLVHLRLRKLA